MDEHAIVDRALDWALIAGGSADPEPPAASGEQGDGAVGWLAGKAEFYGGPYGV